ncbi:DoxX family protein [Streptomyces sp. TRM43335]|uniref:DoxX family protein n=1 Tax=Streptomyces taklimakanensis TaxID=2569853 RepID=A0A6G2BJ55_9ACTN|nr:DoxX family protein [Streptomyces taklimakanensis]MTE22315.1 DoxX family protein [Streptomyces taklimakanensis]
MHTALAVALSVLLITAGIAHFVLPDHFHGLVPSWLGGARHLVIVSGVADIVAGALVLYPGTRPAGGWAAAALITVYLVSHLDALWHARPDRPGLLERPVGAVARLLVNLLYIGWAVAVATA